MRLWWFAEYLSDGEGNAPCIGVVASDGERLAFRLSDQGARQSWEETRHWLAEMKRKPSRPVMRWFTEADNMILIARSRLQEIDAEDLDAGLTHAYRQALERWPVAYRGLVTIPAR